MIYALPQHSRILKAEDYWAVNDWPVNYWATDYWPGEGGAQPAPTPPTITPVAENSGTSGGFLTPTSGNWSGEVLDRMTLLAVIAALT